ncbi:hypothetical protein [Dyella psychrodurans]|uniref:Uncharacterized protein n=1 Tax=Dyella psychrodurans TaxID=1927960 RepID=A0A370WZL5_9GAMM|nr:hypothetical protein [Dyella psychrodurans]RDS81461.1 hypothetical protein DWU99_17490 [Dyella psychrodurans]
MKDLVNRVLMAYRPLYLRGLLMDGQYRPPQPQKAPPAKGKKLIHLTPAFQPGRRRVLIATATAAAVGACAHPVLSANEEAPAEPMDESRVHRNK